MGHNQPGPQTHQSWARTSLAQRRKPNQCWASTSLAQHKKSNGGELFSPSHPPACRPNVLHAGGNAGNKRNAGGRRVYLARRGQCLVGRTASLAVLWWRSVAVSWLTDGDSQQLCYCFKRRRERLLLLPSPMFPFLFFVFQWFPFILSVCFFNFLPRFKLFLPFPMFRFLSFYSLCPLPFGSFFPLFSLFSLLFCSPSPLTLTVPLFFLSLTVSPMFMVFPVFFLFSVPFLFCSLLSLLSVPCFLSSSPLSYAGVGSLFIRPRERGLFIAVHGEQGSAVLVGGRG